MFTNVDYILGHKTNLNTFKRIRLIWNVFSDLKGIKLETNNRKIAGKPPNTQRLNSTVLSNPCAKEEASRSTGRYFDLNEMNI